MLPRKLTLLVGVAVLFLSSLPACSKSSETVVPTQVNNASAATNAQASTPGAPATQTPSVASRSRVVVGGW